MAFSDSTDGTGSTPRRSPRLLAKRSILTPVRKRLIKFVKKKEESQSGTKLASFDLDEFRNYRGNYCDDVAGNSLSIEIVKADMGSNKLKSFLLITSNI